MATGARGPTSTKSGGRSANTDIVYHRPAEYRDLIRVTTRVGAMGGVRATRHTEIRREPNGELLAEVETIWVCIRRSDQRPTRIPSDLLDRYADDLAAGTNDPGT